MKSIVKSLFLLIFIFPIASFTVLKPAEDPSIAELRAMYKKLNDLNAYRNSAGKMYFIDYSLKIVTKDSLKDGITETNIKMWADQKRMEVQSRDMQVYQDEKNAFVVLPNRKMVLRGDPDRRENAYKVNLVSKALDTLFSLSKVKVSQMIKKTNQKRIVLEVNASGQKLLKVKTLAFVVDETTKQLKSIRLDYVEGENKEANRIVYQKFEFKAISTDYKNKVLDGNVVSRFLVSDTQLAGKYDGYKLIDNRVVANKDCNKIK